MLGIENGYAIGKDLNNVERFRKRGVVYMTLCHNGNNDICGSARYNDENLGVSEFGEQVIKEMNRVGMVVDLSHAGERTFYETLEISPLPPVCSHSSCRSLCNHPRNLTDEQLKAIARKGGTVQICLYSGFLHSSREATICDAVEHLHHAVNIMGIDHVGIGSDFDGDGESSDATTLQNLSISPAACCSNATANKIFRKYGEAIFSGLWKKCRSRLEDKREEKSGKKQIHIQINYNFTPIRQKDMISYKNLLVTLAFLSGSALISCGSSKEKQQPDRRGCLPNDCSGSPHSMQTALIHISLHRSASGRAYRTLPHTRIAETI